MSQARALFYGSALYHLALWGPAPKRAALELGTPWPGDKARGAALLAGRFAFAGETIEADAPPWDAERSAAWRASLHGFAWLADLAALGSAEAAERARAWTADWARRFHVYDAFAWRADLIGDRLFAWLEHRDLLGEALPADSVARQARHLARVGAHEGEGLARLRALRGLIAATAAQGGGRLRRALGQFEREVASQILADGGHRARGPASQLMALRCLLDARAALTAAGAPVPGFLSQAIERAAPMVRFFRHGDGGFALFNGAHEGDRSLIDLALARAGARRRPPLSADDIGFERLQAGGTVVLFDRGAPAQAGYDQAAHAGLLAFEMSHAGERIITNCGAASGGRADWTRAMRATAAHSTLVVADTNSVAIAADGTIGAARAPLPHRRAERDGDHWAESGHDDYQAAFGLTHQRQLFLAADGDDLRGEDRLSGTAGSAFAIRFHLHPAAEPTLAPDGAAAMIRLPSGATWRLVAEGAVIGIGESVYWGTGAPRKTRQIILDGHAATAGTLVRWAIRRG